MKAEIVCVLDRSGSMGAIWGDAIGGFNTFLKEQKELPGEANMTVVLFDTVYDVLHASQEIHTVPDLTKATYTPHGCTALYDAVGRTIDSVGKRLAELPQEARPDQVIFVILTDGMENSSHEYTHARVAEMIKHQQDNYAWQFVFLAANQDAFETGAMLNIPAQNTRNWDATKEGAALAYGSMSNLTAQYRS